MNNVIYKIVFPNNKCYIGQTVNFIKRKREHKNSFNNKNRKEYSFLLNKAIRKYGFENLQWNIVQENLSSKLHMDMWEKLYIHLEQSNNLNFGYNMTEGGEGVGSGEVHPLFGKIPWNKNKKCLQFAGENNPMYGTKRPEQAERMRNNNPNLSKPFICIETGKIYITQTQAALELNISKSHFSRFLKKKRKIKGYSFKYLEDFSRESNLKVLDDIPGF